MLVCAHCDSQFIVNDKEFVAGEGWISRPRCMKCGRDKFKEVVKTQSNYAGNYATGVKPANNITPNYSSPMQVGETLVKPRTVYSRNIPKSVQRSAISEEKAVEDCKTEEEKVMSKKSSNPTCRREGCKKIGAFHGYCAEDFRKEFGITYGQYKKSRKFRGEDPREVAKRWMIINEEKGKTEAKPAECEQKQPKPEQKGPVCEQKTSKVETPAPSSEVEKQEASVWPGEDIPHGGGKAIPVLRIFLDPELVDRLTKKAKEEYRTVEQQAAYLIDKGTRTNE